MPAGTWSDESSMAIATMVSILEHGTLIPDEVMKNFVKTDRNRRKKIYIAADMWLIR